MTTKTHPFSYLPENHNSNRRMIEPLCSQLVQAGDRQGILNLFYAVAGDNNFQDGDCEGSGHSRKLALCSYIQNFMNDLKIYAESSTHTA